MLAFRRFSLALSLVAMAAFAGACSFDHSSTLPTSPNSTTTPAPAPAAASTSFIGTWASGSHPSSIRPQDTETLSNCGSFQWAVNSQTVTTIVGTLTAQCGTVTISTTTNADLTSATTASITMTGTATLPGNQQCFFSIAGTATKSGETITLPYAGTTCFGPVSGTETLTRTSTAAAPPPSAAPPPPPPPPVTPPPPPPTSGFDLPQSIILNSPRDLASWPITTSITDLELRPTGVHVEFSKRDGPGRWPDVVPPGWDGPLEYTLGMCLFINNQWYCSAVIEFWNGLDESGGDPADYAQNWFYDPGRWAPMTGHQPAPGETIGFFVAAGDCRNNLDGSSSPVKERSNVVLVPMPGNGGGSFTFRMRVR